MPSIWIGVVELTLRWKFPTSFNIIFDLCNDIKFIFIFVIGYGITAADEHGMKEVIRKGRWYYLASGKFCRYAKKCRSHLHFLNAFSGTVLVALYSARFLVDGEYPWVVWIFYILRGFSEWLFIIGVYGVLRELVTAPLPGLAKLSELAMPFYLTHTQIIVAIQTASSWVPYLSKW